MHEACEIKQSSMCPVRLNMHIEINTEKLKQLVFLTFGGRKGNKNDDPFSFFMTQVFFIASVE